MREVSRQTDGKGRGKQKTRRTADVRYVTYLVKGELSISILVELRDEGGVDLCVVQEPYNPVRSCLVRQEYSK